MGMWKTGQKLKWRSIFQTNVEFWNDGDLINGGESICSNTIKKGCSDGTAGRTVSNNIHALRKHYHYENKALCVTHSPLYQLFVLSVFMYF